MEVSLEDKFSIYRKFIHFTFKFRETWSNQQSPMPCTILIIQTLRHSWICLGEKKTKKKLETIQREVDLPLPVARFHDLFNGPYLLVARCFICTRIFFFACLPASHCSLPGRWWLFSPVVIGFFSTRLCSTGKSTDYSFFAGCVWPRCCCGCCCTVFDRAGPVCAYANRFECLLKI